MPLLSSPFLLLGSLLGSPEWWAARFNVIVVAAGSYLAWRLVRDRIDATLYRRLLLVLLFASYLTNRLRDYNAEVLTATLIALGILCLVTDRHVVLGWGAIVLGVVNTPGALLGLVAIAIAVSVQTRRLRNLLPVLVAVGLIMTEAWSRRSGPFVSGYEGDHGFRTLLPYSGRPGFSYPSCSAFFRSSSRSAAASSSSHRDCCSGSADERGASRVRSATRSRSCSFSSPASCSSTRSGGPGTGGISWGPRVLRLRGVARLVPHRGTTVPRRTVGHR